MSPRQQIILRAKQAGLYTEGATKIVEYPDGTVITCLPGDSVRGDGIVVAYWHAGETEPRWA